MRTTTQEQKLTKGFRFLKTKTMNQRESYYAEVIRFYNKHLTDRIAAGPFDESDWSLKAQNYRHAIQTSKRIQINHLKWLKGAEEYFDSKLQVAASKLLKFGALEDDITMSVVDVSETHNRGLDFYIRLFNTTSDDYVGRVHARLTWCECYEKASHYRFICTLKK